MNAKTRRRLRQRRYDTGPHRKIRKSLAALVAVGLATCARCGRRLLLMFDVSKHFTMVAMSVTAPFKKVRVVEFVRVNHGNSWPGRGDVSWQPRLS